ncbi:hypothetical protein BJ166DRAFT_578070 [Pestalotiopsis sp. NC0098]|nr:hypothetical protein BJ166DRAFT_578070 [Pestalotiopsis sp. NC0098]
MTSSGPPAYDTATSSNPGAQLHGSELASYILDGPFRLLRPIIHRILRPAVRNHQDESIQDPIYYFRTASLPWLGDEATIFLANGDGALGGYKAAICHKSSSAGVGVRQALGRYLVPGQWTVADHFVITTPHGKLFGKTHEVNWADEKGGKLIAVETKSDADGSFRSGGLPVLDLKVSLGDRARDFLVVCWVARIWKDVLKLHDEFVRQ